MLTTKKQLQTKLITDQTIISAIQLVELELIYGLADVYAECAHADIVKELNTEPTYGLHTLHIPFVIDNTTCNVSIEQLVAGYNKTMAKVKATIEYQKCSSYFTEDYMHNLITICHEYFTIVFKKTDGNLSYIASVDISKVLTDNNAFKVISAVISNLVPRNMQKCHDANVFDIITSSITSRTDYPYLVDAISKQLNVNSHVATNILVKYLVVSICESIYNRHNSDDYLTFVNYLCEKELIDVDTVEHNAVQNNYNSFQLKTDVSEIAQLHAQKQIVEKTKSQIDLRHLDSSKQLSLNELKSIAFDKLNSILMQHSVAGHADSYKYNASKYEDINKLFEHAIRANVIQKTTFVFVAYSKLIAELINAYSNAYEQQSSLQLKSEFIKSQIYFKFTAPCCNLPILVCLNDNKIYKLKEHADIIDVADDTFIIANHSNIECFKIQN